MSEIGMVLPHQDHHHRQDYHHSPFSYTQSDHKLDNNQVIQAPKTCSNCPSTKTSLWRSGPLGPKTLCNACYLKNRKRKKKLIKKRSDDEMRIEAAETLVLMSMAASSRRFNKRIR